ncbi:MAG: GAF domain-containing protein, partial [Comamonadaceae bacterium]|nr:GAF domain-containing protein [Comamonadaceae bacterium]
MDALLGSLAHSLDRARSVEELARPLLQLLETVTGLESTYLTLIDLEHDVQRVLYARNTRQLHIPEGLEVDWSDTLCKRALDEQRPFTDDVDRCWADSQAAQALGIKTYASAPVRLADGVLYGTLCAASAQQHALDAQ